MMTTAGICGGQPLEADEFPTLFIVTRGGRRQLDAGSANNGSSDQLPLGIENGSGPQCNDERGGLTCLR